MERRGAIARLEGRGLIHIRSPRTLARTAACPPTADAALADCTLRCTLRRYVRTGAANLYLYRVVVETRVDGLPGYVWRNLLAALEPIDTVQSYSHHNPQPNETVRRNGQNERDNLSSVSHVAALRRRAELEYTATQRDPAYG